MLLEMEVMVTAKMATTWHFNETSFVSAKCTPCSICVYCAIQDLPRNLGKQVISHLCVTSTGWW